VEKVLRRVREDTAQPIRQLVPDLPAELESICQRAMAKSVSDRFSTATDMADALRQVPLSTEPDQSKLGTTVGPTPSATRRAREAERRQVTAMYCGSELFDAAEFLENLDPEDQHELLDEYQQVCEQAVARYGGTIVQSTGTGLLVCFGYPTAFEDAARRAILSGLEIQQGLQEINARLDSAALRLSPWIGIHTSVVIASEKGDGRELEPMSLVGEARSVATQLHTAADPGTVVITAAVHRLVEGYFVCESGGAHKLQGASQPIEVLKVVSESSAKTRIDVAEAIGLTPLVGRDREVDLLQDRWQEVEEDISQVVLLIGEAGLGKSRLVHVIKEHVAQQPGGVESIIEWRCSPYYQNSSLYPVVDYFQRAASIHREDTAVEKLDKLIEFLNDFSSGDPIEVVQLFAALLSIPMDDRYPPLNLSPNRQKEKTLDALIDWLRDRAAQRPVLFVLEDLHWVDPSTLEFLGLLVDQCTSDRVLALFTFRPEFEPPWGSRVHQTQVALNRLRKKQIIEMVQVKTGLADFPPEFGEQIADRTGGVPLFVEEFARMFQDSGSIQEIEGRAVLMSSFSMQSIPATLHDLLMARLDRMDSDREVIQTGATLGREFSHELIKAVSPLDNATLEIELAKLAKAEVVLRRGRPPQATYHFKHALIQDAAYQSMVKKKRQQLHNAVATVLEDQFAESQETAPELLAHHFTEAGEIQKGIQYWLQAGVRAQGQSAVLEAIDHFTRGLALIARLEESPLRDQQELQFLLPLGNVLIQAKGYAAPEVEAGFQRAHTLCQQIGEGAPLFHVSVGMWKFTLVNSEFDKCTKWADELLRLAAGQDDPGIIMEANFPTCCTRFYVGEFAESVRYGEQGFALYDHERCKAHAQFTGQNAGVGIPAYGSIAMWAAGYPDRALKWSREGVNLGKGLDDPFSLAFGLYHLGWLAYYCGNWQEVKECGDIGRSIAEELGFVFFESLAVINQGAALVCKNVSPSEELDHGIQQVREGLAAYMGTGARLHIAHVYIVLCEGLLKAGRIDDAQQELDNAFQHVAQSGELFALADMHRLQGELQLARSHANVDEAESCFRKAIEVARGQDSPSWELRATMSISRLLEIQGRQEEAHRMLLDAIGKFNEGSETADQTEATQRLNRLG
jgi:class 3 adenylate cyclase/predicted ATPase